MVDLLKEKSKTLRSPKLDFPSPLIPKKYILLTTHRAQNTDSEKNLRNVLSILDKIHEQVVFSMHPRTRKRLRQNKLLPVLKQMKHVLVIPPVSYGEMLWLEKNARAIVTDSGGVQKEAFIFRVPCITLREDTEWVETVFHGWNTLTGLNIKKTLLALQQQPPEDHHSVPYGLGRASKIIVQHMVQVLKKSHP